MGRAGDCFWARKRLEFKVLVVLDLKSPCCNQDGGCLGITVERISATPGWVGVRWEAGNENNYRVGDDDAHDLVVVSPLRVSLAGGRGAQVNGRYLPAGMDNGKPKFKQQNGQAIIYFNLFWKINFRDDARGWYYQHLCQKVEVLVWAFVVWVWIFLVFVVFISSSGLPSASSSFLPSCPRHRKSSALVPPLGQWTTDGYTGGDASPAPTVSRAFEVGDQVRFVKVPEERDWSPGWHWHGFVLFVNMVWFLGLSLVDSVDYVSIWLFLTWKESKNHASLFIHLNWVSTSEERRVEATMPWTEDLSQRGCSVSNLCHPGRVVRSERAQSVGSSECSGGDPWAAEWVECGWLWWEVGLSWGASFREFY